MGDQTPKSEMVERVAAAIYGANIKHVGWRSAGPGWHRVCQEQARAAIEAMREPTGEMFDAFMSRNAHRLEPHDEHVHWDFGVEFAASMDALIDAALKPEGGGDVTKAEAFRLEPIGASTRSHTTDASPASGTARQRIAGVRVEIARNVGKI